MGQETAHQSEEVSHKITRLEADLASVTEQLKLAQESEAKARQESLEQMKNAKEAQEKYERELMQVAADVEQLNAVREQLELNRSQFAVVQQTLARTETELESGRTSWESQKEMLEKDASEKSRRCSELDKQIDLMEQQIVTLSARMAAATRVQEIAVRFVLILDSNFGAKFQLFFFSTGAETNPTLHLTSPSARKTSVRPISCWNWSVSSAERRKLPFLGPKSTKLKLNVSKLVWNKRSVKQSKLR